MIPRNQIRPQLTASVNYPAAIRHQPIGSNEQIATVLDLIRRHAIDAQDAARITAQLGLKDGAR